jgi:hypothetical protein
MEDQQREEAMTRALLQQARDTLALVIDATNAERDAVSTTIAALDAALARDERAEFETWCATVMLPTKRLYAGYMAEQTAFAWLAWQAARGIKE